MTLRGHPAQGPDVASIVAQDTRSVLTDPAHGRLLILGAPGSGKTTLMKALASGVSQRQWPELRAAVPVLGRLREYADDADQTPLLDWLVGRMAADFGVRHARTLLDALGRDGQLLLLLDGLDEIGETAVHWLPRRIAELADTLEALGGSRLIVTCREQNYDLLPDPGLFPLAQFRTYRLADLRDNEMEAMIARRADQFRARRRSYRAYLAAIRAAPDIARFHCNPLLLTLSIGLYLNRAEPRVPHNLAELYDQSIENLLRRHDSRTEHRDRDRPQNTTPYRDKLALMQRFALERLRQATAVGGDFEVWPVADLTKTARAMASERLGISADKSDDLVREIHRHAGLIADTGDGDRYRFAHRSLHEFCAARQLARLADEGLALALANLDERDWSQVLVFFAAMEQDNPQHLVETLLERAATASGWQVPRLILAGQCAAVLAPPLTALRERVAAALDQALLSEQDQGTRHTLLTTLIRLGRDAAEPVRALVERTVRRLLDTERPERIAQEIGRLDQTTALSILDFLIDSGEPDRLRAALIGLQVMDGSERVPVLWRLLGLLAERTDQRDELVAAARLMAYLLENPDAVKRLNCQPSLLEERFNPESIRLAYPFTPAGESPCNLAGFLALTAELDANGVLPFARLSHQQTGPKPRPGQGLASDGLSADSPHPWINLLRAVELGDTQTGMGQPHRGRVAARIAPLAQARTQQAHYQTAERLGFNVELGAGLISDHRPAPSGAIPDQSQYVRTLGFGRGGCLLPGRAPCLDRLMGQNRPAVGRRDRKGSPKLQRANRNLGPGLLS